MYLVKDRLCNIKVNKMATHKSTLYKALQFCGRLWLLWFKAALCMSMLSVLASVVKVAVSEDYDNEMYDVAFSMEEGLDESNMSNCSISTNISCTDLPADGRCLNCSFESNCTFGSNTTVTCVVPDEVECSGNRTFDRTFVCQYCYQLQREEDYCCTRSFSCNTRETPVGYYTANCTTMDNVTCLPPRLFQKRLHCNYASQFRWSTAILLSFTLGGFGVDRFYLQLWGSAIGKLISFGGLGVWSILDIILIGSGYVGPADGSVYLY